MRARTFWRTAIRGLGLRFEHQRDRRVDGADLKCRVTRSALYARRSRGMPARCTSYAMRTLRAF